MEIDNTTIKDLSIFKNEDQRSIFDLFDLTITAGGSEQLKDIFNKPLNSIKEITDIQNTIELINKVKDKWPISISNGTLMVINKFYETPLDQIPSNVNITAALQYKILHAADFSLVKYSASHCFDLLKGMKSFMELFKGIELPLPLQKLINRINKILEKDQFKRIFQVEDFKNLLIAEMLQFAYFVRYVYRENFYELAEIFYKLDAWYSMAKAKLKYNLNYPVFIESVQPHIQAKGLFHMLLEKPVSYTIELSERNNFVFLTGANMAGKSTFIKAVGISIFLAQLGMAVPAEEMQLSLFDGILSNINVVDNITKGESYFFNEVQRIKNTLLKITDGRKWLVLIDELFKGTNVEDAMTCSLVVIKGLIKIRTSLFILSTHLYEIGEQLKVFENISFKYFETGANKEELYFSYKLQNGISNDRLGYLILKREKVIELLDKL